MSEGLSASEVGKEISEHRQHTGLAKEMGRESRHDRLLTVTEGGTPATC